MNGVGWQAALPERTTGWGRIRDAPRSLFGVPVGNNQPTKTCVRMNRKKKKARSHFLLRIKESLKRFSDDYKVSKKY